MGAELWDKTGIIGIGRSLGARPGRRRGPLQLVLMQLPLQRASESHSVRKLSW